MVDVLESFKLLERWPGESFPSLKVGSGYTVPQEGCEIHSFNHKLNPLHHDQLGRIVEQTAVWGKQTFVE